MKALYFTITFVILGIININNLYCQLGYATQITGEVNYPNSIDLADMDGDGDLDILSCSRYDNRVAWYENVDGYINYKKQTLITDSYPFPDLITAGDIDGDGDNDFVFVAENDNTNMYWCENLDGHCNFSTPIQISYQAGGFECIIIKDIDGDNDNDILTTYGYTTSSLGEKIAWIRNDDLEFNSIYIYGGSSISILSIALEDIDNDGYNDLIYEYYYDFETKTGWRKNNGAGSFNSFVLLNGPNSSSFSQDFEDITYPLSCGDIDNDGDIDFQTYYGWMENENNTGAFSYNFIQVPVGEQLVDFDNDGDLDLYRSFSTNSLFWNENIDGNGTFGSMQSLTESTISYTDIKSGDINNDGYVDLVICAGSAFKISYFPNPQDSIFFDEEIPVTYSYINGCALTSGDYDSDGDIDIISSGSMYYNTGDKKLIFFENSGENEGFKHEKILLDNIDEPMYILQTIDFDFDGDLDIVYKMMNTRIGWFENIENMTTIINHEIPPTYQMNSFFVDDYDGDNDYDIICAKISNENKIYLIENSDGLGTTWTSTAILTINNNSNDTRICIGDLDNDNDNDIIYLNYSYNSTSGYAGWLENIDGDFSTIHTINFDTYPVANLFAKDIDLDGDVDIIAVDDYDNTVWIENSDGNGNMTDIHTIAIDIAPIEIVDFDGDNDPDIFASNNDELCIIENIDGWGTTWTRHNILNNNVRDIETNDFDSDGDIDLAYIIYHNQYYNQLISQESFFDSPFQIKGNVFFDNNQNGVKDSLDYGFQYISTTIQPDSVTNYTNDEGDYIYLVNLGNYNLTYNPIQYWGLTTDSTEYHILIDENNRIVDSLEFGFYPDTIFTDIITSLTSSSLHCNSHSTFWLSNLNIGTTNPSGVLELVLDPQTSLYSSAIPPDSIIGQKVYWSFDSIPFFATDQLKAIISLPDASSMGDLLTFVLNTYIINETEQFTLTDTLFNILYCSFDPNDKLSKTLSNNMNEIIAKDDTLEYTIRFQNTGNTEAINIQIRDYIDNNLDLNTLQFVASSHKFQAYFDQSRNLVFQFDSIMLPDSNTNEIESHGFVKYRICPETNVLPNAIIQNSADIYFDYNPPIITNNIKNRIECYIAPDIPQINQDGNELYINSDYDIIWFYNETIIENAIHTNLVITQNGDYTVMVIDENGCSSISDIYNVSSVLIDNYDIFNFNIYPNPSEGIFSIDINNIEQIEIYNSRGVLIKTGFNKDIDISNESKGIYFIKVITRNGIGVQKLIIY